MLVLVFAGGTWVIKISHSANSSRSSHKYGAQPNLTPFIVFIAPSEYMLLIEFSQDVGISWLPEHTNTGFLKLFSHKAVCSFSCALSLYRKSPLKQKMSNLS